MRVWYLSFIVAYFVLCTLAKLNAINYVIYEWAETNLEESLD